MESLLFDGPSSCLDPSSFESSSFLSFASFADLTSPVPTNDHWHDLFASTSVNPYSSFNSGGPSKPAPRGAESDVTSESSSSPGPLDLFEVVNAAFEDTPDYGIFHTPTKPGSCSKLSAADVTPGLTHRVSGSQEWDSPLVTPSLPRSGGSHSSYTSPNEFNLPSTGFSWDEAHSQLGASSASYVSPSSTSFQQPLRVASNPALGPAKNARAVKPVQSMPALKEEMDPTFQWFDGSDLGLSDTTTSKPAGPSPLGPTDETLVDDFDWVFGDYGLGGGDSMAMDGTIFAAFKEQESSFASTSTSQTAVPTPAAVPTWTTTTTTTSSITPSASPTDITNPASYTQTLSAEELDLSWLPSLNSMDDDLEPMAQAVVAPSQVSSASTSLPQANVPTAPAYEYTVDPMAFMPGSQVEQGMASRPSSAPKAENGAGFGMLSAPVSGAMSRSFTAPGMVHMHSAPVFDPSFSFTPQSYSYGSTSAAPTQIFADQQQAYSPAEIQTRSSQSSHGQPIRALPARRASHHLAITVQQPQYSTYSQPSDLPLTPQSATFPSSSSNQMQIPQHHAYQMQGLQAPVPMTRAGTQPLPATRRMSGSGPLSAPLPAHLVRAQAIVQMQEAKEQAQRDELRRKAATRRISMAEASVMQAPSPAPSFSTLGSNQMQAVPVQGQGMSMPRSQPAIVGWVGPSRQTIVHPQPMQSGQAMQAVQTVSGMQSIHHPVQMMQSTSLQSGMSSALTTQPLVIHPPPGYSYVVPQQTHRVHPPPHPGHQQTQGVNMSGAGIGLGRPMARLPSPKTAGIRKPTASASSSPAKRSPATKRRGPMQPGGFSWGEATFINFTSDDAQKLLTGVAPSGSQSKRKREEDAARAAAAAAAGGGGGSDLDGMGIGMMGAGLAGLDMDREGSKRSRTGD